MNNIYIYIHKIFLNILNIYIYTQYIFKYPIYIYIYIYIPTDTPPLTHLPRPCPRSDASHGPDPFPTSQDAPGREFSRKSGLLPSGYLT